MTDEQAEKYIEALIFASEKSITEEDILLILGNMEESESTLPDVSELIKKIGDKYAKLALSIELIKSGGGYQFLTRSDCYPVIHQLQIHRSKKKLSQAALETLAIVAYKQPVTKLEIEQIRGVNCDYTIQKLLEKELIGIRGRSDAIGHPILYCTSQLFMDYFGLNSVTELPQLTDIQSSTNSVGDQNE